MTAYTLSVVQLCPDAYREHANAIAEAYGYGPGNLSVELRDANNNVWWGCHAWWMPSALEIVSTPPDEVPGAAEIMAQVVTSVREGGDPQQHWAEALSANGLSVYAPEELA
jgi:hypothetical protein